MKTQMKWKNSFKNNDPEELGNLSSSVSTNQIQSVVCKNLLMKNTSGSWNEHLWPEGKNVSEELKDE